MPWFFAYGISTDPEQMRQDVGGWETFKAASLPDHIYTFTGYHHEFGGATSTIVPAAGGVILGVAYLVSKEALQVLEKAGHGYVLSENRVLVDGTMVPAFTLQPTTVAPGGKPAPSYLDRVKKGLSQHYPPDLIDLYLKRAYKRAVGEELAPCKVSLPETFKFEYGCQFRRLFPWDVMGHKPFGGAWAILESGKATIPHNHDEEETFIFLGGEGVMMVDNHSFPVRKGDVVYLEPFSAHTVLNTGVEPLEILCIWWGGLTA